MVWRVAEGVVERAVLGALQVAHLVTRDGSPSATAPEPAARGQATRPRPPRSATASPRRPPAADSPPPPPRSTPPSAEPAPIVTGPAPEEPPLPVPEPTHVSEEPELVREEAEIGAEEGAGASIRIDPPWDGYDRLGARDVIARLSGVDAAVLAAVQLYESSHRSRRTVLVTVQRQLKAANGSG
jgi:hypothetical protein